jgi:hypothetical protein
MTNIREVNQDVLNLVHLWKNRTGHPTPVEERAANAILIAKKDPEQLTKEALSGRMEDFENVSKGILTLKMAWEEITQLKKDYDGNRSIEGSPPLRRGDHVIENIDHKLSSRFWTWICQAAGEVYGRGHIFD